MTGFREVVAKDAEELARWLADYVVANGEAHLQEVVYQRLCELRIEPPSPERVQRLVGSAVQTYEQRLHETLAQRLSSETRGRLDALLRSVAAQDGQDSVENATGATAFSELRKDPGPIGLDSALAEVAKLGKIRQLDLLQDLFDGFSARIPSSLSQRAAVETPQKLQRHPEPIRHSLLSAFCWVRGREITDNLVELLLQIVHRIGARAEKKVVKEILEDLKRVHGKSGILLRLAEASLEEPDGLVRDVVYPAVGEQTLRDLVREFRSTGLAYKRHVQTRMRSSYGFHFRRMVPALLDALEFRSNNELHRPVIEAIDLLKRHAKSRAQFGTCQAVLHGTAMKKQ